MDDARVETGLADEPQGLLEAAVLLVEVELLCAVCRGEVGEGALVLERPVEGDALDEVARIQVEHADAVHAGVDGQVEGGLLALDVCLLGVVEDELLGVDRRRDVVGEQQGDGALRRLGEQEDGLGEAGLAQLDALFGGGDGQAVCTGVERCAGDSDGPVAVGVCLDHGAQQPLGAGGAARLLHVEGDGGEVNLRPSATGDAFASIGVVQGNSRGAARLLDVCAQGELGVALTVEGLLPGSRVLGQLGVGSEVVDGVGHG